MRLLPLLPLLLAACGQAGPLFLPDQPPPEPTAPAVTVPAGETETEREADARARDDAAPPQ